MNQLRTGLGRVLRGRFAKNTGWMMAQQIYSMALGLVISIYVSRHFGPTNMGALELGVSYVAFFTTVCRLGLNGIIINDIASEPEKSGDILGSALVLRLFTSVISIGAISVLISVTKPDDKFTLTLTMLQSVALLFDVCEVFRWWFQAKLMAKYISIGSMIAVTVMGVWRIVQLARGASMEWFAMSASIQALVSGAFVAVMFFRNADFKLRASFDMMKGLLKRGQHLLLSNLIVQIYLQTDRIMLDAMIGPEALGFYAAAMKLAAMWEFVPIAFIDSARPAIAAAKKKDERQYLRYYQLLLIAITGMGIAVGLGFTVMSRPIVLMTYGAKFLPAAAPLTVIIWATNFAILGIARTIWIISEDLNRYAKYFAAIGAAFNIVTNLIAIPIWGMVGAAMTTLLSQILAVVIAPLFFRETRRFTAIYLGSFRMGLSYLKERRK